MEIKNERVESIDIIKGIGIVLVVLGHSGFSGTKFIYLFHMSIFFIAAGYCYSSKYSESIQAILGLVKRRFFTLYIPYVVSNIILLFFHNIFVRRQIYTDNPAFLEQTIGGNAYGLIGPYSIKQFLYNLFLIVGFVGGEQLGLLFFLQKEALQLI